MTIRPLQTDRCTRSTPSKALASLVWCALALVLAGSPAHGQLISDELPEQAQGVTVDEHTGAMVPGDMMLRRHDGVMVTLDEYYGDKKPIVLVMAYYSCPLVCPVIQEKLAQGLAQSDYLIGRDFRLVVVSFDPKNTIEMAADTRARAINAYGHEMTEQIESGFLYHTASEGVARRLAGAIGYNYRKLPNGEYSHPISIVVLSPKGKITRYFHGFDYPPRELKLSLLDASNGKIARSFGDSLLHFCFSYDPKTGAYSLQAFRVMQLGAIVTTLGLGTLIVTLKIKERVRRGPPPGGGASLDTPPDAVMTGSTP